MRMTKFSQDIAKCIALLFIILLKFLSKENTFIFISIHKLVSNLILLEGCVYCFVALFYELRQLLGL